MALINLAFTGAGSLQFTQVHALMFVTPPLQGGALKRPVAYAVTEFCLAESKAV